MQLFASTLVVAFVASVSALPAAEASLVARSLPITPIRTDVCPQANGLWYVAGKGYLYQIACGIDTTGTTLLFGQDGTSGSQHAENAIQCADLCNAWTSNFNTPQCAQATFVAGRGTTALNCYFKGPDGNTFISATSNIETVILGPKVVV